LGTHERLRFLTRAVPASPNEAVPPEARLLTRVRRAIRVRHYSRRTEKAYVGWIKRFIFFNGTRHPDQMGEHEVMLYLSDLAVRKRVSASTQNQAFSALLFLYRDVLGRSLEGLEEGVRAKRPEHLPIALSRREVERVLDGLCGPTWLVASLLYGSGLRLLECLTLRVKDLDLARERSPSATARARRTA
jgi:integrase